MEKLHVTLEVENLLLKVIGIGIEFLSAGHGNSILQLGTTHLDDVLELLAFVAKGTDKTREGCHQTLVHADKSQTDSGGIDIVG